MGIARGRFVVDTHVHAQRMRARFKETGTKPDYVTLQSRMRAEAEPYDNSARLLYDMGRYGVDMCVIQPAFGMTNELNAELVNRYPDKFIAFCNDCETQRKAARGEQAWTIEAACAEMEQWLKTGSFKGIGEGLTRDRQRTKPIAWEERFDQICQIMELARKYKVAVSYHTGIVTGYAGGRSFSSITAPDQADPMLAHEVAEKYPDVPIIMAHGGMQGWWSEMFMDRTLSVAATHANVYLETGLYWAELYEKPLADPDIGPEKLLWGTDWGASIPIIYQPGRYPPTYANQFRSWGLPAHQIDVMGWSLRQLDKLDISQDDLNLILGGNAVRLFGLKVPHTRMFKEYIK
jgi:predicted TIM-barrel fold metal-dependent hydrolase